MIKERKKENKNGAIYISESLNDKRKIVIECKYCHRPQEMWTGHYYRGSNPCKCRQHHKRLYSIYTNMKSRCYNKNVNGYKNYGGRSIEICDEWLNNYQLFEDWALSHGYRNGLTIERIDVNGNYEPSNCKWADNTEQANNKRNSILITIQDKTQTLKSWCDEYRINYKTAFNYFSYHNKDLDTIKDYLLKNKKCD